MGNTLSDFQIFYTPASINTSLNLNEKLTWNETRSNVKSPETYNFGLDRSLNLDYKLTNNIASKYAWSGQSKLNEYRGYAWTALRDLDPGVLTQATQSFNTTFNPTILKWLKPALNYSANYRWSDDLTREGQNISTQLRFGSNFSITPSQIIELVYKPKSGSNNRNSNRSRNSRNRTRSRTNNSRIKVEEIKENKVKFKPMIFIHSMFKKINPISLSYTENLNRSANQVIGEVPLGYKFGWVPDHGLKQSIEAGSNLGAWDHKRDGSIRSGLKLTRSININTNFSQNFTVTRSSSGLEQLTMSRDYFALGKFFNEGLPFPWLEF